MSLVIDSVAKKFDRFPALKGVSLTAPKGCFMALLGPSGSGKTTLLRILGGLAFADVGHIAFDDLDWLALPARERRAGFVFQQYALFRHMTVAGNIAFGLNVRPRKTRPTRAEIARRVEELLALVQLDGLGKRYPSQLSGGQRQRVALARALAIEPRMLLLDEPFGALDAKVRKELRRWLRQLHDELHVTSIFVTHDQEEALEVADRVVLMNKGHVEQLGTPADVYNHPASPFVYGFLGNVNLFHGRVHEGVLASGDATFHAPQYADVKNGEGIAYVRPHDLDVERYVAGGEGVAVKLRRAHAIGPLAQLDLERADNAQIIEAVIPNERYRELGLRDGETLLVKPRRMHVFVDQGADI